MIIHKKIILVASLVGLTITGLNAFAPNSFFPSYDPGILLPSGRTEDRFSIGANIEYGATAHSRNRNGKKANVLQIYNSDQSTLAMLENPAAGNAQSRAINALKTEILIRSGGRATDDGVRGHVLPLGKFEMVDITPHARYQLPWKVMEGRLAVSLSLPIRSARIYNVSMTDQTKSLGAFDQVTKDFLSGSAVFQETIKTLGNLDLGNWSDAGVGDAVLLLDWHNNYPQDKDDLQNVTLSAKLGVVIPTGKRKNEDKVLSIALGKDGAWGLPFGIGMDLDFKHHIRLGGEVNFELFFDNSKIRRLKTHDYQTDFLLLNKGRAVLEHGLLWKFYLYLEAHKLADCLSFRTAYEYIKHDSDKLTPKSDDFTSTIINTAGSLTEWNTHHFIFSMTYQAGQSTYLSVKPLLSIFYTLPLTGKAVIQPQTVGGQLAISF